MLRPLSYCRRPGCPTRVRSGYCARHAGRSNARVRRWYYTLRWSRLRAAVLVDAAYTCAHCGQVTATLDVDHIVRHDGYAERFWSRQNLQALCKGCHAAKTLKGD